MRTILHCDLNNFFASVECLLNPSLAEQYVAVCGDPSARHGIVLAKNNLAKSMGVKTAETIIQAKQKCPQLVCVAPHYHEYVNYSKQVKDIYSRFTDIIESFGIDECWLDVTHSKIFGDGAEIAEKLRKAIKAETGLTISIGVSWNKTFAKLGSDIKKPDAVTIIDMNNYKQVVWRLPASDMLGVGKKTAEHLNRINIFTIGDLANADESVLRRHFGIVGKQMLAAAQGNDTTAVSAVSRDLKSVGHGTTTIKDVSTYEDAGNVIFLLSEMIATRMRRYNVTGSTVAIDIRFNDLNHITRQCTLSTATCVAADIANGAISLLKQHWLPQRDLPLRTITVSVSSLQSSNELIQNSFWSQDTQRKESLEKAFDKIRGKYGFNSILRSNLLGNCFLSDKFCDEDDLLPFKR